jgi:hypothetical protein
MHAYRKDNTASEMYDKDIFLMQVWILNMILKLINNSWGKDKGNHSCVSVV